MEVEPLRYSSLMAATPVVLVSTLHGEVANVAPFGMVMPVSHDPPMLALGIKESRDTFANIQELGEFVVGVPGPDMLDHILVTAKPFPRDISEFEEAGLTKVESRVVKPYRIGECQTNLECRLVWVKEAGDHHVVVGQVVAGGVRDDIYRTGTRDDLDPLYHLLDGQYARRGPKIR